ncbi:hypothetical protein BH10ACT1_BH10ACT1_01790 [soil metagenome]
MAAFLSQEWLDAQVAASRSWPEVPGLAVTIQQVVPGAPDGEVRFVAVVADGRLASATLGVDAEAELTLTTKFPEAKALAAGELDANVAFMRGRIKVAGPTGPLLRLLAATKDPAHRAAQAELAAATTF